MTKSNVKPVTPSSPDNRYKAKLSARVRRASPNPKTPPKAPKIDNAVKRKSSRVPDLHKAPDLSNVRMAKRAKGLLGALCDVETNGMLGI